MIILTKALYSTYNFELIWIVELVRNQFSTQPINQIDTDQWINDIFLSVVYMIILTQDSFSTNYFELEWLFAIVLEWFWTEPIKSISKIDTDRYLLYKYIDFSFLPIGFSEKVYQIVGPYKISCLYLKLNDFVKKNGL